MGLKYAEKCTEEIVAVLKAKLSEDELDKLAASIAYDTANLHDKVEDTTEFTMHQDECEKRFNRKHNKEGG